jgi:peptide/nickel transport system substrate-binding protein
MRRVARLVAMAIVVASLVSACAGPTSEVELVPENGATKTFTFAMSGDASALDPWNVVDDNSLQVTQQIFEPLVTYDTSTFEIRPNLAVSWQVSSDKRQWTLKLREGVTFHDGTEFNSEAVVFNFERARRTDFPHRNKRPVADDYEYYQAMWGGLDEASLITKVEAFDKLTVRFTTRTPFGPFLATLAMATFGIVSPASITADPEGWMLPTSRAAAGTGPFTFSPGAWVKGDEILLTKNHSYWRRDERGTRLPYVDRVRLRALPEAGFRVAALRGAQADAIRDFAPADLSMLKNDPKVTLVDRRPNNVGYLRFNTAHPPLDNPDVRRAMAMAIDRDALVDGVFAGYALSASQFLAPGMIGYDDAVREYHPYDPEGAKRVLAQANASGLYLELWYMDVARPYFPDPRRAAESIARDLRAVGVNVVLRTIDFTAYRDRFKHNLLQAWLYGWTGDNGDPDNFLCVFFCNTTQNGSWSDTNAQQAVRFLRDAAAETDAARRGDLYRQASRLVQKSVPAVPLVHADVPVAVSRFVTGYVPHPKGSEPFTFVQVGR